MKFNKLASILIFLAFFSDLCLADGSSIGEVHRIYYNHDGYTYFLLTSGNNSTECYHSAVYGSHRISNSSDEYNKKLSLIMMAFAAGKTLHLQDINPNGTSSYCDIDIVTVTN